MIESNDTSMTVSETINVPNNNLMIGTLQVPSDTDKYYRIHCVHLLNDINVIIGN